MFPLLFIFKQQAAALSLAFEEVADADAAAALTATESFVVSERAEETVLETFVELRFDEVLELDLFLELQLMVCLKIGWSTCLDKL